MDGPPAKLMWPNHLTEQNGRFAVLEIDPARWQKVASVTAMATVEALYPAV
jgi:hypothetical protein